MCSSYTASLVLNITTISSSAHRSLFAFLRRATICPVVIITSPLSLRTHRTAVLPTLQHVVPSGFVAKSIASPISSLVLSAHCSLYSLSSVVAFPLAPRRACAIDQDLKESQIMVGRLSPDLVTWIHPGSGHVQGEKLVLWLENWDPFMFITEAELKLRSKWKISYWEEIEGGKRGIVTSNQVLNGLESLQAKVHFSIDGPGTRKENFPLAYQRALWSGLTNGTYLEQETGIKLNSDVDYVSASLQLIIKQGFIPKRSSAKTLKNWDAYKARNGLE